MKRRRFVRSALASSATAGITCMTSRKTESVSVRPLPAATGFIAGFTPARLRDEYHYLLFSDYLPFSDRFVVDHDLGGFMCTVERDGTRISTEKYSWFQGRGAWAYAFLYNKLDHSEKHLDVLRKTIGFIEKMKLSGPGFMPNMFTKEGNPSPNSRPDLDGDIYMALAFQEYGKIPGNEQYWDRAKEIFLGLVDWYDNPDFTCSYGYTVAEGKPPEVRGPRVIGYWMEFINIATQMLAFRKDPAIEAIADRTIDAVMKKHYNPDFGLINEVINHDMTRNADLARMSYVGHAIETLWMLLYEALRRKDTALFNSVTEMFMRHVEVAWDDVYGGAFRSVYDVDENTWALDKVTWLQEEILIGTLCIFAHTGSSWAKEWFERMYAYAMDTLSLKRHGYALWATSVNRRGKIEPRGSRCENYHHPRHLMLNLVLLDKLVKNGGKPLGVG